MGNEYKTSDTTSPWKALLCTKHSIQMTLCKFSFSFSYSKGKSTHTHTQTHTESTAGDKGTIENSVPSCFRVGSSWAAACKSARCHKLMFLACSSHRAVASLGPDLCRSGRWSQHLPGLSVWLQWYANWTRNIALQCGSCLVPVFSRVVASGLILGIYIPYSFLKLVAEVA